MVFGVNWWTWTSNLYRISTTKRCEGRRRPAVKNASNTTNSPLGSGTSSAPGTCLTLFPKYANCCISCTRTEEILETPNSTVWPGCNSATAKSLKVSSDDESAGGVFAADEEEDDIATYRRRRRAVCLTRARSPMQKEPRGQASGFKKLGFSGARKGKNQPAPHRPFLYTQRDASGNPQSNSVTSHQRSPQKPQRDHFERGQRLHHLATSSAPDDSVELVPRRANVGAKVKTLPFARSLRRLATLTKAR
jgi:hypothetical protein